MITCHHLTESRDLSLTLSKGSFVIRFCELYKGLSQGFCFCWANGMQQWSSKLFVLISCVNLKSILEEGGQNIHFRDRIMNFCVIYMLVCDFSKSWGGPCPPNPHVGPSLCTCFHLVSNLQPKIYPYNMESNHPLDTMYNT